MNATGVAISGGTWGSRRRAGDAPRTEGLPGEQFGEVRDPAERRREARDGRGRSPRRSGRVFADKAGTDVAIRHVSIHGNHRTASPSAPMPQPFSKRTTSSTMPIPASRRSAATCGPYATESTTTGATGSRSATAPTPVSRATRCGATRAGDYRLGRRQPSHSEGEHHPGQRRPGDLVHDGASAQIVGNRLSGNHQAAITISDRGVSATVSGNVLENSHGLGIWVSDAATAGLERNQIIGVRPTGILSSGIAIDGGSDVQASENVVRDAPIGVVVENSSGSFAGNQLLGNAAGSWCLIDPGKLERDANHGDAYAPGLGCPS